MIVGKDISAMMAALHLRLSPLIISTVTASQAFAEELSVPFYEVLQETPGIIKVSDLMI